LAIETGTRHWMMTASACWLASSACFAGWLYLDQDASLFWPALLASAWISLGVGLVKTQRYHSVGIGIVVGVAVAVLTASVYTVVAFAALADEIGPDATAPAAGSPAVAS